MKPENPSEGDARLHSLVGAKANDVRPNWGEMPSMRSIWGVGRFGLHANGVEILQFVIGGLQGELSFTSLINGNEINFPILFPSTGPTTEPAACMNARSTSPDVHLSIPFSVRNLLRNTAPPEFGEALLICSSHPTPPSPGTGKTRKHQFSAARSSSGST